MEIRKIDKNNFDKLIHSLSKDEVILSNLDYFYDLYDTICDGVLEVNKVSPLHDFTNINHISLILYILNEFDYIYSTNKDKFKDDFFKKEDIFNLIASICCDKYLTNEELNFHSKAFLNRFDSRISTIELFLNFILGTLEHFKEKDIYRETMNNLLKNSFKLGKCITSLLINGFDAEAFSTWRTMHENESIVFCLMKYGKSMFDSYIKHINYALAYRNQIKDKEKVDAIFFEIKKEMKEHDLKSKDMKKFIEYGYLFSQNEKKYIDDFKLNFRDGVENLAGLSMYSKVYELSSEIAHSSPLLIFSNREFYFNITILNLYETFIRLEGVFLSFYKSYASEDEFNQYQNIRKVYLTELIGNKARIKKIKETY